MKPARTTHTAMLLLGVVLATFAGMSSAATASKTQTDRHSVATRPDISGTWERTPDDWFGENPDDPVHPGGPMDLKASYAAE
ncbi:hypothetical protein ACM9HO_04920, partial [Pseudomonas sp. KHB2.9]